MNVKVLFSEIFRIYTQRLSSGPHAGQSSSCRLLHNFTEVTRKRHFSLAGNQRRFDLKNIAADFRPG